MDPSRSGGETRGPPFKPGGFGIVVPPREVKASVLLKKPPDTQGHTNPSDQKCPPGVDGISRRFSVGFADMCGTRDTMEDKMVINGSFRGNPNEDFFAVFDGHSGSTAAAYAAKCVYSKIAKQLEFVDDDPAAVLSCLHESFIQAHREMQEAKIESGTTGVTCYFQKNQFFIANVGDSRIVVSQSGVAKALSVDQKPGLPSEKRRIIKLGGWVTGGRVQSKLAVARALGDFPLNPYICCEPEVFGPWYFSPSCDSTRDSQNFDYMIVGCDGLWDVCDNQTAVNLVAECKTAEEAAVRLRNFANDQRTRDNVSVIVIFFPGYVPGRYPPKEKEPETSSSTEGPGESSSSSGSGDSETSSTDSYETSSESESGTSSETEEGSQIRRVDPECS